MRKYFAFVIFSVLFAAAAASCIIRTAVSKGIGKDIDEILKPFEKIGESYYLVEPTIKRTWIDAAQYCRTQGAYLAGIETEDEWKALSSYLVSEGYTTERFWIAGNDIDEALKFVLINTGQPMLYTKWSVGQPDNTLDIERCVHLWLVGDEFQMNDWRCDRKAHYICKANTPQTVAITVW